MIRRPPRSTLSSSSAASDVYKRQVLGWVTVCGRINHLGMYYVASHLGQLSLPSLRGRYIEYRPVWLGVRRGEFTCVGWKVTLCDPIVRQVTPRCSEMTCHGAISFNFNFNLLSASGVKEGPLIQRRIYACSPRSAEERPPQNDQNEAPHAPARESRTAAQHFWLLGVL